MGDIDDVGNTGDVIDAVEEMLSASRSSIRGDLGFGLRGHPRPFSKNS